MNKNIVIILIISLLVGCKKHSSDLIVNESAIKLVKNYMQSKIDKAKSSHLAAKLTETFSSIDFTTMQRKFFNYNEDILVFELNSIDVDAFLFLKKNKSLVQIESSSQIEKNNVNDVTSVIFYINKSNEITEGVIVNIKSNNKTKKQIQDRLTNIIQNTEKDFTGIFSVNSLSQKLLNKWSFVNGSVTSSTVVRMASRTNSSSLSNNLVAQVSGCIYYYLEVTYFWSDGSTTTEQFPIGTICDSPQNEGLEPPGEGGGSILPDTTCAQSKRLDSNLVFKEKLTQMRDSSSLSYEMGYRLVSNGSGYTYEYVKGDANNINSFNNISGKKDGFLHTHRDVHEKSFSIFDIAGLYTFLKQNHMNDVNNFIYGVVPHGTNKVQILRISDSTSFDNFGASYLLTTNIASTINSWGHLFSPTQDYENQLCNLLTFLNGSGLTLFEKDLNDANYGFQKVERSSNGNLKRTKCLN